MKRENEDNNQDNYNMNDNQNGGDNMMDQQLNCNDNQNNGGQMNMGHDNGPNPAKRQRREEEELRLLIPSKVSFSNWM